MATFTIDSDANITAHPGALASADESQSFSNAKELAKLTAEWAASRLVETWNSFAGVAPFDDLKPSHEVHGQESRSRQNFQGGPAPVPRRCATGDARANGEDPVEEVAKQGFASH